MLNNNLSGSSSMGELLPTTTISSLLTTKVTGREDVQAHTDVNEIPPDPFENLRTECYERLNQTLAATKHFVEGTFCRGTFDGWLCWPDTPAGTSAYERCPEFITGFDPLRYAHKECDINGEWFKHPLSNKSWSNYTTCVNLDDLEWKHNINLIYEVGYGISLVAILLSLSILGYFKSLKCARITLHMNLFTSFAANNSLWLVWYLVVMPDADLFYSNICLVTNIFRMQTFSFLGHLRLPESSC